MDKLTLYIGNKNYSSWSFRPWIALEACGVPFEEVLIPFDFPAGNPAIREVSPTGKVPMLVHDGFKVWESLAIIEYAAELFPDAGLLPRDRRARSLARSYSMEMLSGFRALRNACPMNMRRPVSRLDLPEGVMEDLARGALPLRRSVPVRCIFRRRCDVCARGQPFGTLRHSGCG